MNVLSSLTNAVTGSAKAASAQDAAANPLLTATKPPSSKKEGELKTTFQTFVAGSFYKQMLKSLHKMHKKPAYFHGGRAEEIFQGQMDQEVSETLAKRQGDVLSGTMYKAFAQRLKSAAKS